MNELMLGGIIVAGLISNSLLTVLTWYYILNKTQENIKETLGEVKSVAETIRGGDK
jgi:hypothetical protein